MGPAPRARDRVAGDHAVVAAVGIGQQNLVVILEEILRSVTPAVQSEVEDVVGMIVVAHIDPHPRISGFTGGEHGHDGVIGAHHVRGAYAFSHQFPQRLEQIRHVAAPDRLCGARDFEALAGENVLDTGRKGGTRKICWWRCRPADPGPAMPFSIAVSGLVAVSIRGLSPLCSHAGQAYFLRT